MMAHSSQTRKSQAFLILRNAVDALELQASPDRDLESLETAFKEFHQLVLVGMTDLVGFVGGDPLYIPVPDFLSDDIGTAFQLASAAEDRSAPFTNQRQQYGTLNRQQQFGRVA